MAIALATLAVLLGAQATALACRLHGLLAIPRATPRALWPLLAALALCGLGWLMSLGDPLALLGLPLGLVLAFALPSLWPLHADRTLLEGGRAIALPGHGDAQALLLPASGAPRGTVILAHGLGNDRSFGLWHLVPRLRERGCAVLVFHLPGHGEGGTDLATLELLRERFDAAVAAARAGGPVVAVGQSMGGATVLDALARGAKLDGAVTVSAIARLELGTRLARELGVALHAAGWRAFRYCTPLELLPAAGGFRRDRFPVRVAAGRGYLQVFAEILDQLDLVGRLAQSRPGCPLLLIHGSADGIVPVAQARALAAALGERAEYLERRGLHHLDPLFDEAVVGRLLEFVSARLK